MQRDIDPLVWSIDLLSTLLCIICRPLSNEITMKEIEQELLKL